MLLPFLSFAEEVGMGSCSVQGNHISGAKVLLFCELCKKKGKKMQRGGVFVYVSLIPIRLSPFAVRSWKKLIISNKQPVMAKGERRMIILTERKERVLRCKQGCSEAVRKRAALFVK